MVYTELAQVALCGCSTMKRKKCLEAYLTVTNIQLHNVACMLCSTLSIHFFNYLLTCYMQYVSWDIKLSCILLHCIGRISEIEPKYYADGEDAYAMRRDLSEFREKEKVGTWTLSPSIFFFCFHTLISFFFSFFLL